jgi:hypothetical protein
LMGIGLRRLKCGSGWWDVPTIILHSRPSHQWGLAYGTEPIPASYWSNTWFVVVVLFSHDIGFDSS